MDRDTYAGVWTADATGSADGQKEETIKDFSGLVFFLSLRLFLAKS